MADLQTSAVQQDQSPSLQQHLDMEDNIVLELSKISMEEQNPDKFDIMEAVTWPWAMEATFKCKNCGEKMEDESGVGRHERNCTKQSRKDMFNCNKCERKFSGQTALVAHTKKRHAGKGFKDGRIHKSPRKSLFNAREEQVTNAQRSNGNKANQIKTRLAKKLLFMLVEEINF